MTLPANDAFTFGLAHADTSSSRRRSPRSPSPSPRLSLFSSAADVGSRGSRSRRQSSKTHAMPQLEEHDQDSRVVRRNGSQIKANGNGTPASLVKTKTRRASPPKSVDWEIPRKALHSSIGFFTLYLYTSHGSPRTVIIVLSTALAIVAPADFLRLRYPAFERLYERCLGFLMRESEKRSTNGVTWYIIGCNFVLSVFPLDVAVVAILILSWADTAASTFGRLFGSYTPPLPSHVPILRLPFAARKSLAGFVAASVSGACIAAGFWGWIAPVRSEGLSWAWQEGIGEGFRSGGAVRDVVRGGCESVGLGGLNTGGWIGLLAIGVFSGIVAGVAEALDLGSLDDNLTLPIISGGCLWGFFKLLGLFSS